MATNPMLQAVLLWQHHQNTAPYLPGAVPAGAAQPVEDVGVSIPPWEGAKPLEEKEPPVEEVEEVEEEDGEDEEDEETEEEEEEENGEKH
jgi:hypothetical protein